jgi:hypothetical protein
MGEGPASKKTCGDCARFKVPDAGCPNYESFTEYVDGRPLMDAHCAACSDFHQARGAKDKKTRKQMKDSGVTSNGCFEAIYHDGKPCFLVWNSENFSTVESLEVDGQAFYPKEQKNIPYESYGFYGGSVPNREELFWKVRSEFQSFIDVESIWKDVLSAFVLLSYQQEKLQSAPYIFLYGDNESGKSTVLQLLKFLSYRPLYGVTIPAADIYGYLEDSDSVGTVLEDEIQGIHKDIDKVKIYKAGYKRGATVPRTIITQHDRIIKYYGVFSLKACASEQLPTVKGFRERFIEIPMVEGYPEKEWSDITKEDLDRLHNLRNMLLKWRMLSREWQLPEVQLSMKGRVKELWKPLLQITHGLTVHDGLLRFVEDQKNERLSTKQNTLEGHIVKIISSLYNQGCEVIPFSDIWQGLVSDLDGKLDDKKPHVMDTSDFFQVTKNKIGYRLREVLSGKTKPIREKDSEGNDVVVKAYVFDPEKLRRIAKKYGYEFVTKLPSLPSSEGAQAPESMEKTMEKDVEKNHHTPQQLDKLSNLVTSEEEAPPTSNIIKNSKEKKTVGEKDSNLVTNGSPEATPKPTIRELLEKLWPSMMGAFTEEKLLAKIMNLGFSREEAQKRVDHFKAKELIIRDDIGNWHFLR